MFHRSYPHLWRILKGPQNRNIGVFGVIILLNLMAAVTEGGSFAALLAALSRLSNADFSQTGFVFSSLISHLSNQMSNPTLFLVLIAFAVFLQGMRTVVSAIAVYLNTKTSFLIQNELQKSVYQNIFRFSFQCISEYKVGDLVEHTKTPSTVINAFMDNANRALVSGLMVLVIVCVMFYLDYKLAFFTLSLLLAFGKFQQFILSKIGNSAKVLSDSLIECSKQTTQAFQIIRAIHSYNRQDFFLNKINNLLRNIISLSKRVYLLSNFSPMISEMIGTLLVTAILLVGFFVLSDHTEQALPILLTFLALTHRLAVRLQIMSTALSNIVLNKGLILRLEDIISDQNKEWIQTGVGDFKGFKSEITFEDVFLYYPSTRKLALNGISFSIPRGKVIAIVGKSGAGKSSILDLILGLYQPTKGSIKIDGADLSSYSLGAWRDKIGVVSQDVSITNDTIRENICFGLNAVSDEQLKQAIVLAGMDSFIELLPNKLETVVGERGFRLSGGQKQRIALARALIRNPELLILDEATSSLDSHSESLIQEAIEKFHENRTVLIVAHRLSTIKNSDIIYVLDHGKIVELGDHKSLMHLKGVYDSFWKLQKDDVQRKNAVAYEN